MQTDHCLDDLEGVVSAYRRLLESNPDKALRLSCDSAALFNEGRLVWAMVRHDGTVNTSKLYEFDPGAWDENAACWDGESSAIETADTILHTSFIDL